MSNIKYARLLSSGSALPDNIVTNDDLSKTIDTNDDWIYSRTGIKERRIVVNETTSDLAFLAAQKCIENAGIDKNIIDLIIVCTTTGDLTFPSVANMVQARLGIKNAGSFDISAACSGFVYGMHIVRSMINVHKTILLIGAESMSKILDWNDRGTCVLFGDGAGAFIFQASESPGILDSTIEADCDGIGFLKTSGGVSLSQSSGKIIMCGRETFQNAVERMSFVGNKILEQNNMTNNDITWLVTHQANKRIMSAVSEKMCIDKSRVISTVSHHANTSAASIPLAYDLYSKDIKNGDIILFIAFGAGFVWGAVLLKYIKNLT